MLYLLTFLLRYEVGDIYYTIQISHNIKHVKTILLFDVKSYVSFIHVY